jgi:hypothetical protein
MKRERNTDQNQCGGGARQARRRRAFGGALLNGRRRDQHQARAETVCSTSLTFPLICSPGMLVFAVGTGNLYHHYLLSRLRAVVLVGRGGGNGYKNPGAACSTRWRCSRSPWPSSPAGSAPLARRPRQGSKLLWRMSSSEFDWKVRALFIYC